MVHEYIIYNVLCNSTINSCSILNDIFFLQSGREISDIIVTDDYLCHKEQKIHYNFFILIFNELFKFKTSDKWQN